MHPVEAQLHELAERCAEAATAIIGDIDCARVCATYGTITVTIATKGAKHCPPRKPLTPCERAVLMTLAEAGKQMTRAELLAAMAAAKRVHPEKAITAALSLLSREPYMLVETGPKRTYFTLTPAGVELAKLFTPPPLAELAKLFTTTTPPAAG